MSIKTTAVAIYIVCCIGLVSFFLLFALFGNQQSWEVEEPNHNIENKTISQNITPYTPPENKTKKEEIPPIVVEPVKETPPEPKKPEHIEPNIIITSWTDKILQSTIEDTYNVEHVKDTISSNLQLKNIGGYADVIVFLNAVGRDCDKLKCESKYRFSMGVNQTYEITKTWYELNLPYTEYNITYIIYY